MFLKNLQLTNFRNFKSAKIDLNQRVNIFVGKNAQGKTNIIEAINLFATGRSFRNSEYRDLIEWKNLESHIKSESIFDCGSDELHIHLSLESKNFFKNSKKTTSGGFKGVGSVLFAPEETLLFKESPSVRRKYLDTFISQLDFGYRTLIRNYERVVAHRNKILQDMEIRTSKKESELLVWDEKLSQFGSQIIITRARWIDKINDFLPIKYDGIAKQDGRCKILYKPHDDEKNILSELLRRREEEYARRTTLVGPHRDDILVEINDADLASFGSQGQHRSVVLAIKMSEVEIIQKTLGEIPILLLDDVASELDRDRNKSFFDFLTELKGQIFITATDSDSINLWNEKDVTKFEVINGNVVTL